MKKFLMTAAMVVAIPYVIGVDAFQRYMQLMGECSRMVLARAGIAE